MEILNKIQKGLKAPKGQVNSYGGYKYRSCEDILEAVKPLLGGAILTISDDIIEVAGRVYVKATATIRHGDKHESVTAYAREAESKKGMDSAQLTGACSSYARKYALNGLFCIDDTKDADTMDNRKEAPTQDKAPTQNAPTQKKVAHQNGEYVNKCIARGRELNKTADEVVEGIKGAGKILSTQDVQRIRKELS